MISTFEDFISVKEFAALCGINHKAVYERKQRKQLTGRMLDGNLFVNKKFSVVVKRITKKIMQKHEEKIKLQPRIATGDIIPLTETLVSVRTYSERLGIRTDSVYERIICNEMDAVVVAGNVFVDKEKYPYSEHKHSRKLRRTRKQ